MSESTHLKKNLGLGDVMGIALGQVIGSGIMTMTGIGIQMSGSGVTLAYIISSLLGIIAMSPIAILGGTLPTTGGLYKYTSRLLSPKIGVFWLCMFTLMQITLAMYAISFAQYLQGVLPEAPITPIAFSLLTLLFIVNLVGVKTASIINKWMVIILILSLSCFVVFGLPKVDYTVFQPETMFPAGFTGFFTAIGLVGFATGGAQFVAELGGEMKNPRRDLPIVIIGSTVLIGFFYALIAAVAVGVLPIEQVAGQPLTAVANEVLPKPVFVIFIVGGAMFALATTLNATFTWVTKSLYVATQDGVLPKKLGAVNEKFGTPHWLLTIFYIIGAVPILTNVSLNVVAQLGTSLSLIVFMFPVVAAGRLPKLYPEAYANAPIKLPPALLKTLIGISVVLLLAETYLLITDLETHYIIGSIAYVILAALFAVFSDKITRFSIKNTNILEDDI